MRRSRLLAAAAALALSAGFAAPVVAAPAATTFHGTFSHGVMYFSGGPGPGIPLFDMPVRGDWNLNVNLTLEPGQGRARAVMVVRYVDGGLHALWTPGAMDLRPLTSESEASAVLTDLGGVVNDPAEGLYAFSGRLAFLDSTIFVVYNAGSETFFYAALPGPDCVPPADIPDACFFAPEVFGTGGRQP